MRGTLLQADLTPAELDSLKIKSKRGRAEKGPRSHPALLLQFTEWMRTQRGTLDITLNGYRQPILDLLDHLGTEPSTFDAIGLREFLLRRVGCFSHGAFSF